ncbi:helix-turn-helix domain-containing protein [Paenibacillus sp. MMS18-CY102]|uniref:helix-turn-helix domain-containing protein n=1 Tax=Paenibacillus sp. MMS18-CY102 TaxID=2682849 RepID=UPI0013667B4B|nr:helix-turn-helix transcriptional regulator [Paenibacillus sp. MMS18-CY102]MWC29576.1 helix-turn-helix domain-containing protein [Paenibacillus sp. MMS18-CY102]
MKISERIRQLRVHKKMTQGELVEGIASVAYLSRIENGQIRPSSQFLHLISSKLGVELEYLVTLDRNKYRDKINGIVQCYRKSGELPDEDVLFLNMHALELHDEQIHLQIYATLVSHYAELRDVKEACRLYGMSKTFIPDAYGEGQGEHYFFYYLAAGNLFLYKQNFFQANHYYAKAEPYLPCVGSCEAALLFLHISLVKQRIVEDKRVCFHYAQKAHDGFKALDDHGQLARALITLGFQSHLLHRHDSAMGYLIEAQDIVNAIGDSQLLAMLEYAFGCVHQSMRNDDDAICHFEKAAVLNESISFAAGNVYVYKSLVEIYRELKAWSAADDYLDEALLIAEEHQLHYDYIELCAMKAGAYKLRADEAKYEKEMQRLVAMCIVDNQLSHVKPLASELGAHYYDKRAYKKAADYCTVALAYDRKVAQVTQLSVPIA